MFLLLAFLLFRGFLLLFLFLLGVLLYLVKETIGNAQYAEFGAAVQRMACFLLLLVGFDTLTYQKDYDWRADQARENVKCSLVVFADGKPVLKVPVGASHEIGSDPDMHRMIDGHLYTDYSTDTHTVIKKDGVLLFRYPRPEAICGMEIIGEDIFTLGESRSGDGFALRRNGEAIFERDAGGVIGEFINDNDCQCFAFYEPVKNTDGQICRYYAYDDGNVSQVAVRDDIKEVWDILVNKDRVRYVADLTGLTVPVIVDGTSMTRVALPVGASMVSCRLFSVAGDTGLEGICRLKTGSIINAVWIDGYMLEAFDDTNWIWSILCYKPRNKRWIRTHLSFGRCI